MPTCGVWSFIPRLRLERFVGTSERLNVARLCSRESAANGSNRNFEWRDNYEESSDDRVVTVRERALIKGPTFQILLGSFHLK